MVLFVAGTDTTSQALSWAFYQLACLPELQEELAAQLKTLPDGHLMPDQLDPCLKSCLRICQSMSSS